MAAKKKSNAVADRFGKSGGSGRVVEWDSAESTLVYRLVVACARADHAVLFGRTPDRGAWSVTFFQDGVVGREYFNNPDSLNDELLEVVEWWEGYAEETNP